ncbi:MAG TPA: amidase [Acidimicrobiales bacterium]|jgi:aspartyl-tRNA(Asn)/glutamyl-tRNA(Gln) amidotransferase subunit A|nr:amidase [Acidimicrobiales bacterium]
MTSTWQGDACSLVDAFRRGEHSPVDELDAALAAIDASPLNAFCHLEADLARARAAEADVRLPFGGVPMGVKQLDPVDGWPATEASLVFADRTWSFDATQTARLRSGGANLIGQTTASEFGGLNIGLTRLNGVTRNPWNHERTTGGSSAGSAAAVAGGLVPIATGGDGGGSIRIPAGFCGLVGMKGTAGRIPRGPHTSIGPLTVVMGCMARSARDVARWYDVCAGYDPYDPYSLPRIEGWERDLDHHDLAGKKVVITPDLGGAAVVAPAVAGLVRAQAELLAKDAGLEVVDVPVDLPGFGFEWAIMNLITLREELGDRWPECKDELTTEMAFGMSIAESTLNLDLAAKAEASRRAINDAMAALLGEVDFVMTATNPDVAFGAEIALNTRVREQKVGPENNGALTIPANVTGVPAISIPSGTVDGLPVGLQVIGHHHSDALLLDLARIVEAERPWPLVAA